MKCLKKERRRGGFTLVELVITLFLFLLVAGLVLSYISFMNSYSANNQTLSQRFSQLTALREEIDYWFSYFDSDSYKITTENSEDDGVLTIVTAKSTEEGNDSYYSLSLNTEANTLIADYPEEQQNTVSCSIVSEITITEYSSDWTHTQSTESNVVFRFEISMHVNTTLYACEIVYQ